MKAKGILFKGAMIRALLNSQVNVWPPQPIDPKLPYKAQTRRAMKPQPSEHFAPVVAEYNPTLVDKEGEVYPGAAVFGASDENEGHPCPYPPGTILYAKETFAWESPTCPVYLADQTDRNVVERWKPSIFMPKTAARLWLEVVKVRVERVNQISHADARVEGVILNGCEPLHSDGKCGQGFSADWVSGYRKLWDSINGAGDFAKGKWVWVYDIKRINKPEGV